MYCLSFTLLLFCGLFSCPGSVDITDVDDYDPGTCDKTNLLQVVSVKDRNDQKKLWICQQEHGNYLWKPVNGKASLGEFLQPGYDCSDILNHEAEAQNGFYWVTFKTKTKRKVWCDMTTDGGGYMLVARKHDAVAWDVPSKDKPADPQSSDKYWTSQLGDAPILDFRIQLSTRDSFDDIKAQWSYRLKNKRPLGQLMVTDRGCDSLTPGIGDIAYVKDMMTEKIVTTTFNCSVFGTALSHSQSSFALGWSKMNECLKKPCSGSGYLRIPGAKAISIDHTGVFSYSVSNTKSGIGNDATAYVGCLHKKCCGCFGSLGGTENYCNGKCDGSLGGTVVKSKKLFTWIWVRSSLPKRIWNRCMEFQKQDENGQNEWYSLIDDSTVPRKGRCQNPEQIRLNSGVVVVPDSATAKKVPKIPGLLEYRKDEKQLYVRANETWKSLSDKKEVNEQREKLADLKQSTVAKFAEIKQNTFAELEGVKKNMSISNTMVKKKLSVLEKDLKRNMETRLAETNKNITALKTMLIQNTDAELAEVKQNLTQIITLFKIAHQLKDDGLWHQYPQCKVYKWLVEYNRRSSYDSSSQRKCDSHLSGWYRFGKPAGTHMYTSCKRKYACNTHYPGYLSDGHPGANDGIVSRTVCFDDHGTCCGYTQKIRVLNCGSFYVYELNGTPLCDARYCGNY